jgi:hypothetical protein
MLDEMVTRSDREEQVGAIVARIGTLLERAHALAARPAPAELEAALADGYACVLALEADRARIERRSVALFATGRASRAAARELRVVNAQLFDHDRELVHLRSLLGELRDYVAAAVRVA